MKARYKQPSYLYILLFRTGLEDKDRVWKSRFYSCGYEVKRKKIPPQKRKALLIKAQLETTGLHWHAAAPRKSWTDVSTITHMSKHYKNTVWPGRS